MSSDTPNITPLFTVANQVLANFFRQSGADNYVSHIIEDLDHKQDYLITMQRVDGETPLHQLAATQERVTSLESTLDNILAVARKEGAPLTLKLQDIIRLAESAIAPK